MPFFVVRQQGLGYPEILGGLLLGDAALLAQQFDDTIEFHDCGLLSEPESDFLDIWFTTR